MVKKRINSEPPLAYSYVRMSTGRQRKGDSFRRQTQRCKEFAAEQGWKLKDLRLEDIGVSAFTGENAETGALSKFLEKIKEGGVPKGSFLIVESLDRLSRQSLLPAITIFLNIINANVGIATTEDRQIYTKENIDVGQLTISIGVMERANNESRRKSERVGEAWSQKRKNISNRKLTSKCPAWLRISDDRKTYNVIDEKAAVVKDIFERSLDGEGDYSIARSLNRQGIVPFGKAKDWGKSYIAKILQNRSVFGEFLPHKLTLGKRIPEGDPIEHYFPTIVDEDIFGRVQVARKRRMIGGGGRQGEFISNLFTKLANCFYCSEPMHYFDKGEGPKGGRYLKCSKADKGSDCCKNGWRYTDFEKAFLFFCREIDFREILEAKAAKQLRDDWLAKISLARDRLTAKELQREAVFNALLDKGLNTIYMRNKMALIESEIVELEKEKSAIENQTRSFSVPKASDSDHLEWINRIQNTAREVNREERLAIRNAILDVVESVRVAPVGNIGASTEYSLTSFQNQDFLSGYVPPLDGPFFVVNFVGNHSRFVAVDPDKPYQLRLVGSVQNYTVEDNLKTGGENWSGSLNAQFQFELSEEEFQRRFAGSFALNTKS